MSAQTLYGGIVGAQALGNTVNLTLLLDTTIIIANLFSIVLFAHSCALRPSHLFFSFVLRRPLKR